MPLPRKHPGAPYLPAARRYPLLKMVAVEIRTAIRCIKAGMI